MDTHSLADFLPEGSIITGATPPDWRSAVTFAGDALVATGATDPQYTAEMINTIETLGPYIVIAPGFALAHSRPSPAVHHTGISWVSLSEPVLFGAGENDPVRLVVGLAALDHDAHIDIMSALAEVLDDPDTLSTAIAAKSPDAVRAILSHRAA